MSEPSDVPGRNAPPRTRLPKRVTLADVALEAGVSVQTASHVLSGSPKARLPQTTRDRVKLAAERVGYRPNRLAQAMKRGRTNVVSVWMPLDRPVLNYMRILNLVSNRVRGAGYEMMVAALDTPTALEDASRLPYVWPVDGIISVDAGKAMGALRDDRAYDGIPIAVLGFEQFPNSDTVGWDVCGAAASVTEKLLGSGRRRIVHLTPKWIYDTFPKERRRRGYTEAMAEAGLEPVVIPVPEEKGSSADQALTEWIDRNGCPEAVSAFNDSLAVGAARALLRKGISIPDDCRVWGFGDQPEAEDYRVPLSTVRHPWPAIVAQAWDWLQERCQSPNIEPRFTILDMELVERDS